MKRRPPKITGPVKVLPRRPQQQAESSTATTQSDNNNNVNSNEQNRLPIPAPATPLLNLQQNPIISVEPTRRITNPDPRFAAIKTQFTTEFLELKFSTDIAPTLPRHPDDRPACIARSLVATFEAAIMRVLMFHSANIGAASRTNSAQQAASTVSSSTLSQQQQPFLLLSLIDTVIEPLNGSNAVESMDEMCVALCKDSASIEACLAENALSAISTWRLEVGRLCANAVLPVVARVEAVVRDFSQLVASSVVESKTQHQDSDFETLANAAKATRDQIEHELASYRRCVGAWRDCVVHDLQHCLALCHNLLAKHKSFAAGEALLYQVKILEGDVAREEAHMLSTAHAMHQLLNMFTVSCAPIVRWQRRQQQQRQEEAAERRKQQQREAEQQKEQLKQQQQEEEEKARREREQIQQQQEFQYNRGGGGRGGGGRGGGGPVILRKGTMYTATEGDRDEYRRAEPPTASQMPPRRHEVKMQAQQLFVVKESRKKANQEDNEDNNDSSNNNNNNLSSDDASNDHLLDQDVSDHDESNSNNGNVVDGEESTRPLFTAALSPAEIDRLVLIRSCELPNAGVVTFAAAQEKFQSAAVDCPWRGTAFERLALLLAKFPYQNNSSSTDKNSNSSSSKKRSRQEEAATTNWNNFDICRLLLRAASCAVDPESRCVEEAVRRAVRKAQREIRRQRQRKLKTMTRSGSNSNVGSKSNSGSEEDQIINRSNVADCVLAWSCSLFQALLLASAIDEDGEELSTPTSPATPSSQFPPKLLLEELQQCWIPRMVQCLRFVMMSFVAAPTTTPDSPVSLFFLRFAVIVVEVCGVSTLPVLSRVAPALSLLEIMCDSLQQQLHQQQEQLPQTTSLPSAIAFLAAAAVPTARDALRNNNSHSNNNNESDPVQRENVKQFVTDTLTRLRTKLLCVRDVCDSMLLSNHEMQTAAENATATNALSCDDVELFGLPRDLTLLLRPESKWWDSIKSNNSSSSKDEDASLLLRKCAVRYATKVPPAEYRAMAAAVLTPPHKHDLTFVDRTFATTEQVYALRVQRLSSVVRKVLA